MRSTRDEILLRYLRLREISKRLHEVVLNCVSGDRLLDHAPAPADRSRAIDRYAKSAKFDAQSDERLMLDAMRASQFAILLIKRRHDTVGLIATDILRNSKVWLLDVGLESSMDDGELIATRLLTPGKFSMTAGVNIPFGIEMDEPICMCARYGVPIARFSLRLKRRVWRRSVRSTYTVKFEDNPPCDAMPSSSSQRRHMLQILRALLRAPFVAGLVLGGHQRVGAAAPFRR